MEVGVVTPRSRRGSVHRILSTLTSLMPSLCRARLMEDTTLSAPFRLSLGCSFWISSKLLWSIVGCGDDGCFLEALTAFLLFWTAVHPPVWGGGGPGDGRWGAYLTPNLI